MRALAACAVAAVVFKSAEAVACGCFASTTTVDPVIQAGERIVFVQNGNTVTAYVQIKFQGDAASFGWLLPVPAVPDVKVGTDELFEVLDESTRPSFALTSSVHPNCRPSGPIFGCASRAAVPLSAGGEGGPPPAGGSPLVLRDTSGPYEYAVLKADSQAELQTWLNDNRFFVPGTTDAALKPYIRPGAYFLALKLRSGKTVGDLRPIVLNYTSDYPMIPLILTSATAVPNMGVQVFVLGDGRAIPRNYHHVELNLLKLDWDKASNYGALVTAAVAEAPEKHAFVTEYAGTSSVATGQLLTDPQRFGTRFGVKAELASLPTPESFVSYLYNNGFTVRGTAELSEAAMGVLEPQIPYPPALATAQISRQQFYTNLTFYLAQSTQQQHPEWYAGWSGVSFNAATLAEAVWADVAQPVIDAEAMLKSKPWVTRMFTTLSPEDMTKDPVFAINKTLPAVQPQRGATRLTGCSGQPTTFAASGYELPDESRLTAEVSAAMPNAARVEQLSEEGEPTVVTSYTPDMSLTMNAKKCAVVDGAFFAGLAALWLVLRRRKVQ